MLGFSWKYALFNALRLSTAALYAICVCPSQEAVDWGDGEGDVQEGEVVDSAGSEEPPAKKPRVVNRRWLSEALEIH